MAKLGHARSIVCNASIGAPKRGHPSEVFGRSRIPRFNTRPVAMIVLRPSKRAAEIVRPSDDLDGVPFVQPSHDPVHVRDERSAVAPACIGQQTKKVMRPKPNGQIGR